MSSMMFCIPVVRVALSGHSTQENTTISSSFFWTAIGKDVTLPSGTSSCQVSTTRVAP